MADPYFSTAVCIPVCGQAVQECGTTVPTVHKNMHSWQFDVVSVIISHDFIAMLTVHYVVPESPGSDVT